MGPHNRDTRINWDDDPRFTLYLLDRIASDNQYRSSIFGNAGDRWIAERDLCIDVLKDEAWIKDALIKGLVEKINGKWQATSKWTSSVGHPVRNRINLLIRRMDNGWYEEKYQLDPFWTSPADLPRSILTNYAKIFPYYFQLRDLWRESLASKPGPSSYHDVDSTPSKSPKGKERATTIELSPVGSFTSHSPADRYRRIEMSVTPFGADGERSSTPTALSKRKGRPPGSGRKMTPRMAVAIIGDAAEANHPSHTRSPGATSDSLATPQRDRERATSIIHGIPSESHTRSAIDPQLLGTDGEPVQTSTSVKRARGRAEVGAEREGSTTMDPHYRSLKDASLETTPNTAPTIRPAKRVKPNQTPLHQKGV